MDDKLSEISLQPLTKSSEETVVAHEQAELEQASQGDQEQKKGRNRLGRWVSPKGKSVFIAVTTILGYLLVYFAIAVIQPFYPIWALQKGANLIISGFVIGMASLSVMVLSPILGVCLPHLGVKFSQVAGLFLAGGSYILFGFLTAMPSGAVFIAFSFTLRAVEGVGTAMYGTASYTLLTQLFSEHKGMIVAVSEVSIVTGFVLGAPIGGLLQSVGGFKLPFVSVGAVIMVLVLVLFLQQFGGAKSDKPGVVSPKILCQLFKSPMVTLLVAAIVMNMTAIGAVLAMLGHFLHVKLGLAVAAIGAIYIAIGVPYIISSIIVGRLTDKLNPRHLVIIGLLFAGIAMFFAGPPKFISEPKLWIYIVVLPFMATGSSLVSVPVFSDIYNTASTKSSHDEVLAGAISGILVATIAGGEFLGPALGGIMVYYLGYPWMTMIFSGAQVFMGLVLIAATVVDRLCRRRRAAAHSLQQDETQVPTLQTEL